MRSSANSQPFKVAIVQHAPVFLNLEESLRKAEIVNDRPQEQVSFAAQGVKDP